MDWNSFLAKCARSSIPVEEKRKRQTAVANEVKAINDFSKSDTKYFIFFSSSRIG